MLPSVSQRFASNGSFAEHRNRCILAVQPRQELNEHLLRNIKIALSASEG
jgi:hypothetical protein